MKAAYVDCAVRRWQEYHQGLQNRQDSCPSAQTNRPHSSEESWRGLNSWKAPFLQWQDHFRREILICRTGALDSGQCSAVATLYLRPSSLAISSRRPLIRLVAPDGIEPTTSY